MSLASETLIRLAILIGVSIAAGFAIKGRELWRSEFGRRIIGWSIVAPIYLASIFVNPLLGFGVIALVMLLGLSEVHRMAKLPMRFTLTLGALAIITAVVAHIDPSRIYALPILYFFVVTTAAVLINDAKKSLELAMLGLFTCVWIFFSLAHFELLTRLSMARLGNVGLLVLIGFAVPLSDVFAYLVGKGIARFDRTPRIASHISKNKTVAGALGNVIGASLGVLVAWYAIPGLLTTWKWIVLGTLIGVMGLFGDLTESMVKRRYGVKDSGHTIPGHGGVLDRIDSALRVVVTLYYVLLFL